MVLRYLCTCKWQTLIFNFPKLCNAAKSLKTPIRSYSASNSTRGASSSSFTTSYLNNTCGLSGKSLIRASHLLQLKSSEKPNSVLNLFKSYGFSQTHFPNLISGCPILLSYDPEKIIKPKLDFLLSITNSETDVIQFVTKDPKLLTRSLGKQLIPFFNVLISVMGSHQNALAAIKCSPRILRYGISGSWLANVEFLQTLGLPRTHISKLVVKYGQPLSRQHDRFRKAVVKAKEMGLDSLSASSFINAITTMVVFSDSKWESRFETYRSFGLSNEEILSMFIKEPNSMTYSMDKIRRVVQFFVNKLSWSPSSISNTPKVLRYSFEKRTIPRFSVLQALVSKKRIKKIPKITTILAMADSKFVKDFVTEHKNEVPELMDAYQGKLVFDEYNFHLVGKKQ